MLHPFQAARQQGIPSVRPAQAGDVVIDTNAVLAMWWFGDPAVGPLAAAIEAGRLRWWATEAMRGELAHVLTRLTACAERDTAARALEAFDRCARLAAPAPPARRLPCRDPDDQIFVDLALERGAGWLFSRDRAVLALRRRAAAFGLRIARPDDWEQPPAAS